MPEFTVVADPAKADVVVEHKLTRGRYVPQIAAEMFHDRHGEWPGRCKWAVGQRRPKARNMFAHNHWQNLMADQRRDAPTRFASSYYDTMDRAESARAGRFRGMIERARQMATGRA